MKSASQVHLFSNPIGGLELADVALLLDQIPQAAFLIDSTTHQILIANAKACELSQRTPHQLKNLSLQSIFFTNLPLNLNPRRKIFLIPGKLITANRDILSGQAYLRPLSKRKQWLLLVFTPAGKSFSSEQQAEWTEKIRLPFDWIDYLFFENSLLALLSRSLEDLMELSTSENGYVYTALADQTHLTRVTCKEATAVFPPQLSIEDLTEISSPFIWTDGQATKIRLTDLAQKQGQRFLIALLWVNPMRGWV